jgi:PAS domain S-box-containing protein
MLMNCELLIKNLQDALFLLDKDGYIKFCNPAAAELTGYSNEELLTHSISVFYPYNEGDSRQDSIKTDYELRQAEKTGNFVSEGWRRKKDETVFWGEMTYAPVMDDRGNLAGFSCVLRNTTAKKKSVVQLKQSEERTRLMVEAIQYYSIFMIDVEGLVLTWNEGAIRLYGYTADEVIGKHFSNFYPLDDIKEGRPQQHLQLATANGKCEENGWRVRKNGSAFWASVVLTALFSSSNQLIGFSNVVRDETERREQEELLRQSEERYRLLVEQVTDYGIFMMDDKGRIVSWNEGAKRIKGYQAQEIIGKYFSIFYPQEDIINGKPAYELQVARKVGKYEEEGWRLKKDGKRFWANIVITAVYNDDGALIGFSKVTRDLTERKKSEKALRDSYDTLRKLASELKITNDELSYANEELEQFTSIASHDLQEPLRSIRSYLELTKMKLGNQVSPELSTYLEKALGGATRMRELIQNLLQYSQLDKSAVKWEEVCMDDVIHESLQNLATPIGDSHAEVVVNNKVDYVWGDKLQLVQLVQNLVSNAIKFTTAENPKVEVCGAMKNGFPLFSVSDNGIGIAPSDLEKVFEIFKRLHARAEFPGTGIGLAICKKIVERHKGKIWPESEPGKGTTFHFTLNEEKI